MTKPKAPTLKNIANALGCSIPVVSTVLNDSKGNIKVSAEKRQKILALAKELNYHPNFASRSLKSKFSRTIGIYVQPNKWHGLSMSYEMAIFRGIEKALREENYDIMVLNMCSNAVSEVCIKKIAEHQIDGILFLRLDTNLAWIRDISAISNNIVAIDYDKSADDISNVSFDNEKAIYDAVKYLKNYGHKRIGFIGHVTSAPERDVLIREKTFQSFTQNPEFADLELITYSSSDVPPDEQYCQIAGRNGFNYFFNMEKPPSAILTFNSLVGLAALQQANALNIKIPDDISIMCIDSANFDNWLNVNLTYVDHPLIDMGYSASKLLINKIENRINTHIVKIFSGNIINGNSIKQI